MAKSKAVKNPSKSNKKASRTASKAQPLKLVDGMDSGVVSEAIKKRVLGMGAGICAWPECLNRIVEELTLTGECAHIQPRKVGSSLREDYKTSLKDRSKVENLFYLCDKHHKIIDNNDIAEKYPADTLKRWKKDHEEWAIKIRKDNSYLPAELQSELLKAINASTASISEEAKIGYKIIDSLLDKCRTYIARNLMREAELLLNELELLLVDTSSKQLRNKFKLNHAAYLVRQEKIPEARIAYKNLILESPNYIDALGEYVELGLTSPDKDSVSAADTLSKIDPNHPVLEIRRLLKLTESEKLKHEAPKKFSANDRLNGRILMQRAIIYDKQGDKKLSDQYLQALCSEQPYASRPYYFKAALVADEAFRFHINDETRIKAALDFSYQTRELIKDKDPLVKRDLVNLNANELKLTYRYGTLSGNGIYPQKQRDDALKAFAECYFDEYMDSVLPGILFFAMLKENEWKALTNKIIESDHTPSSEVIDILFVQGIHAKLIPEVTTFIKKYNATDLLEILDSIQANKADEVLKIFNRRNDSEFTLKVLQFLPDHIQIIIAEECILPDDLKVNATLLKIRALVSSGFTEEAISLFDKVDLNEVSPFHLYELQGFAYNSPRRDFYIKVANRMLGFSGLPNELTVELHAQLASTYFNAKDDTNAINHATSALDAAVNLHPKNAQSLLMMMMHSYRLKGQPEQAITAYEKYTTVPKSSELLWLAAETYLKTTLLDKFEKCFSTMLDFYKSRGKLDDKSFFDGFVILNELNLAGYIELKNQETVSPGHFIQLENGDPSWFYIGSGDSYGAVQINEGTSLFNLIQGQALGTDIEWPAYKFSQDQKHRKVAKILDLGAYLKERASEGMRRLAKQGTEAIWEVNVEKEDGSFDFDKMKNFLKESNKHQDEFFDTYVKENFPFSTLCKMERGIVGAIGKIQNTQRGFIRSCDATFNELDEFKNVSRKMIEGVEYVIDPLSLIMLAESQLLSKFISAAPKLKVTTSTLRLLRNIATDFDGAFSSKLRGVYADGEFLVREVDHEAEKSLRIKLLEAADLLDADQYKIVPRAAEIRAPKGKFKLSEIIPDYVLEPLTYAKDERKVWLTEDNQLRKMYQVLGLNDYPEPTCSWAVCRVMAEAGLISWDDYRKYFALLASYRFHALPLSTDDLLMAINTQAKGIHKFEPRNLYYYRLRYTLSADYGVNDELALTILCQALVNLLVDEAITIEMADEVFPILITEILAKRPAKILGPVILNICDRAVSTQWSTRLSQDKFDILMKQLDRYANGTDPIVNQIPGLLRIT